MLNKAFIGLAARSFVRTTSNTMQNHRLDILHVFEFRGGKNSRENVGFDNDAIAAQLTAAE